MAKKLFLGVIIFGVIIITVLNQGVLIRENRLSADYALDGATQDTLVCTYLTITGSKEKAFWYSSNDIMGKSRCLLFASQM
jgi:hypothetical protein